MPWIYASPGNMKWVDHSKPGQEEVPPSILAKRGYTQYSDKYMGNIREWNPNKTRSIDDLTVQQARIDAANTLYGDSSQASIVTPDQLAPFLKGQGGNIPLGGGQFVSGENPIYNPQTNGWDINNAGDPRDINMSDSGGGLLDFAQYTSPIWGSALAGSSLAGLTGGGGGTLADIGLGGAEGYGMNPLDGAMEFPVQDIGSTYSGEMGGQNMNLGYDDIIGNGSNDFPGWGEDVFGGGGGIAQDIGLGGAEGIGMGSNGIDWNSILSGGKSILGGANTFLGSPLGRMLFGGDGSGGRGGLFGGGAGGGGLLGSLLEAYGKNKQSNAIADAMRYAVDKSDPFAAQRGQYQSQLPGMINTQQGLLNQFGGQTSGVNQDFRNRLDNFQNDYRGQYGQMRNQFDTERGNLQSGFGNQLRNFQDLYQGKANQYEGQFNNELGDVRNGFNNLFGGYQNTANRMFNDPEYWNNNSLLAGLNRNAINDTSKAMAAQGYNMSGNVPIEIAQRLQGNNAQFAGQQQQNYTNMANAMLGNYNQAGLGRLNAMAGNNQALLNSLIQGGLGGLNAYSNVGLGSLNALGSNNANMLNNFSSIGTNNLGQFNTSNANYLNALMNQIQGQGNLTNQVSGAAGAGFGPGSSGLAALYGGQAAAEAKQGVYGALGAGANSVLRNMSF